MSDIAWHPDNATRVVTGSEDDTSPIIMVWDLRNARAPEKILTGHEKGVLSLSWCKQDADLLLSCGKDNRALCWNPQTSEIIGELPSANNWAFQVDWCPRNPDLLATASFDGTIGIHSIQSTNEPSIARPSTAPQPNGADIFDAPSISRVPQGATFSLKQPPKWLLRPASISFGFGGRLVTVSNLMDAQGKAQSSVVHIRNVTTEQDLIERAAKLQDAIQGESLQTFAEGRLEVSPAAPEAWKALLSLFKANSRDELVTLLGFSKAEVAARVAEAVENLKTVSFVKSSEEVGELVDEKQRGPVVSFAEPERQEADESDGDTPGSGGTDKSETSGGGLSDTASGVPRDFESTTTAPSLFGDDLGPGTPQEDFFSTIMQSSDDILPVIVPHMNYGVDSSVAATIGSRPSSVSSEIMKSNTFKIYPAEESETDRLVTKALVLGDFESAVSLCLSSDRFADAILLAVRGGPGLLRRTQKAYFERRTTALPYLRLFQSIVSNDLSDIVQNADLQEWREIFVVLCTFAKEDDFAGLAEQLGARLEFQSVIAGEHDAIDVANEYRRNATLTYLAAARLERLVNIWNEEMSEDERVVLTDGEEQGSRYSAHVHALQTFIEKVTVFRAATKYVDEDLNQRNVVGADGDVAKTYKLASLYDRYFEYSEMLAMQGLVKEAAEFVRLTPADYKVQGERERLLAAAGTKPSSFAAGPTAPVVATTVSGTSARASVGAYGSYPAYANAAPQPVQTSYYAPPVQATTTTTAAALPPYTSTYAPTVQAQPTTAYGAPAAMQQPQPNTVPPPPQRGSTNIPAQVPPPPRKDNSGWNDAPIVPSSRVPVSLSLNKPAAITSPFPNVTPSPGYVSPTLSGYGGQTGGAPLPPPPRPSSVQQQQRTIPPPPQAGQRLQQPPGAGPHQQHLGTGYQPIGRSMSTTGVPPPRQPTPSQYPPPPGRGPIGQTPPPQALQGQMGRGPMGLPPPPGGQGPHGPHGLQGPGTYVRGTPSPGQFGHGGPQQQQPQQQGPYAPPPQQQQQQQALQQQPLPPQMQQMQRVAPPPLSGQHGPGMGPPGPHHPEQPLHASPSTPSTPGLVPPHRGPPQGGPPGQARTTQGSRMQTGPPPPKYPSGDRSHIPDNARPIFDVLGEHVNRMKQVTPPQQRRVVDDLERRLNALFDALNCETLSESAVEQLLVLVKAMEAQDRPAALAIHVDLLTRESQTENIALWMSGIKQLILRI
ncbi:hypothetical protein AX15_003441 [Amanita polypyramis BW_CC]|nr:hypothetical protein AX15_003441 [Amanita polypyramis BW_CC]